MSRPLSCCSVAAAATNPFARTVPSLVLECVTAPLQVYMLPAVPADIMPMLRGTNRCAIIQHNTVIQPCCILSLSTMKHWHDALSSANLEHELDCWLALGHRTFITASSCRAHSAKVRSFFWVSIIIAGVQSECPAHIELADPLRIPP